MKRTFLIVASILILAVAVFGGVTGSISGTVTDKTNALVSGARVVAVNVETGVRSSTQTNAAGFYSFPDLPIGRYSIEIQAQGFSGFRETGLVLDVNSALRVDVTLEVGAITEVVKVSAAAAQVETQSTQMGEVIGGKEMVSLPLNGRDYTELMALQPGVVPSSVAAPGAGGRGEGTLSISGARESFNGFTVNGGNVQDPMSQGTNIIPNLDSIAEFRILTSNFDAEYGHYAGGVVNVVTKSGTNRFHGDAFEFLRNTNLDARNYYATTRNDFRQNMFGGTFGGPIVHDKLFFFVDYEGTRQTLGGSGFTPVPSAADRQGNLIDEVDSNGNSLLTGSVIGPAFANTLSTELGYPVSVGEPFYVSGCTTATCVFPNAVIPESVWSAPAKNLLQYIPLPNVSPSASKGYPTGAYTNSGSSSNSTYREDKGGGRIDANTRWGMLSGYYHYDGTSGFNPDGFSVGALATSLNSARGQLITFGDTKSITNSSVNEFRLSYERYASQCCTPTGPAVDLASLGFTVGCNTLGICSSFPFKNLPPISFNSFTLGGPGQIAYNYTNVYQMSDNYSKILGTHSLKLGGIYSLAQTHPYILEGGPNGFGFTGGAETGLDFADFLLGAVSGYGQGDIGPQYLSARYYGVFAQDSWRVRPNLTFNYGLRWDVSTPWWEKYNRLNVILPGAQSASFPGSPTGWVFPGDPGIPSTIAPTRYGNVAPRLGLAYSPDPKGGVWQKLTGGAGKTSIRASWGMFYTDFEGYTNYSEIGGAPFGFWWSPPTPPEFATPFVDLYTGHSEGQRFPAPFPPPNTSPSNPDTTVNWAQYEPITSSPAYNTQNKVPYTENYMLSVQRSLGAATVLSMSYVGSQGHHLMVSEEANPSTPSVCLSVSQASEVAPGSNVCGPFSETGTFTTAAGQVIEARQRLGPNGGTAFGSDGYYTTIGNSTYNALEVSLRHTVGRLSLLGSYTYSKSMDQSSQGTDQVYVFNPSLSRALSAFDLTHNFVVSYSYELPFDRAFHPNRLTRGWIVSGITRFTTGFPVSISEPDDRSLIGNTALGWTGSSDEPNYVPGKILHNTNPRNGGTYFNTSLFSQETLGQFGNARRQFFHGPGTNNWDMALLKDLHITESKTLEFRAEFFNTFNHTQFYNPDGNFLDGTFGVIGSAANPRIGQLAVKFMF
jgi:hypothetical protein